MIKVTLLQEVANLGPKGWVVDVSDGYANNFLLPKSLARRTLPEDLLAFEKAKKEKVEVKMGRKKILTYVSTEVSKSLEQKPLKIEVETSSGGRTYTNITPTDIRKALDERFKALSTLKDSELVVDMPAKLERVGRYSFDIKVELAEHKGKGKGVEVPIYVELVSVSKARRAKREVPVKAGKKQGAKSKKKKAKSKKERASSKRQIATSKQPKAVSKKQTASSKKKTTKTAKETSKKKK